MSAQREVKCPDCEVAMVKGFMPDRYRHIAEQTRWVPGEMTFWGSLTANLYTKGARPIVSYRCPKCGLLREYA